MRRCPTKKAPGPDGIPNEAIKIAYRCDAKHMLGVFNACVTSGHFPVEWKTARLVLVPKPIKTPAENSEAGDSSSANEDVIEDDMTEVKYRPLCMLNGLGKIYERLLSRRINKHLDEKNAISDQQFGFRSGRSTIDAIARLKETVAPRLNERRLTAAIGVDIKNAFNTARWDHVLRAFERRNVPGYLLKIIRSYFKD